MQGGQPPCKESLEEEKIWGQVLNYQLKLIIQDLTLNTQNIINNKNYLQVIIWFNIAKCYI